MSCSAFISWEVQDNVKLRSIIDQTILRHTADSDYAFKRDCLEEHEHEQHKLQSKRCVSLCPFQHPELTTDSSSRDSCELRLSCEVGGSGVGFSSRSSGSSSGNGSLLHSASVTATARAAEIYNGLGEYTCTIRGVPVNVGCGDAGGGGGGGSGGCFWCRFTYVLPDPSAEIKFKFLSLASPGCLKLFSIRVMLLQPQPQPQQQQQQPLQPLPSAANAAVSNSAVTPLLPPPSSSTLYQQQQHQHPQLPPLLTSAASRQAVNGLRQWLDARLEGVERRLDDRLTRIEARLAELTAAEANLSAKTDP